MPFNFEIDGDWDESSKPYDKKTFKTPKLDDSGPALETIGLEPLDKIGDVPSGQGGGSTPGGPPITDRTPDDVRIKQLEAVTQEIYRKIKAIEAKLGVGKDGASTPTGGTGSLDG